MGKIGEFLNNKPWHPSSRQNQTLLLRPRAAEKKSSSASRSGKKSSSRSARARSWMPYCRTEAARSRPASILCTRLPRARTPKGRGAARGAPTRPPWRSRRGGSRRRGGKGRARADCRKGARASHRAGRRAGKAVIKDLRRARGARRVDPAERQRNRTSRRRSRRRPSTRATVWY